MGDKRIEEITGRSNKGEALLAAAELERRKYESNQRLVKLDQERHVLEEFRDSLAAEGKLLDSQVATAEEEIARLAQKIESVIQRTTKLDEQISECKQEIVMTERRYSDNRLRERQLQEQVYAAENTLKDERTALSFAKEELETGRSLLVRMDQKLSLNRARE